MTATFPETLIARYLDCWNTTDPDEQRRLIESTFTPEATYRDPLLQGDGYDGIEQMMSGFQAQYPGARFERDPDSDDGAQFGWRLLGSDGAVVVRGRDAYTIGENGLFAAIDGSFVDQ